MKTRLLALAALVFIQLFGIEGAQAKSYPPLPEALQAMENADDSSVTVSTERLPFALFNPEYFIFRPKGVEPVKGFLFYPGGLVDPRSYAPTARAIADAGYLVVIVSMPFDLAPFGWNRGVRIMREFSGISTWAVGGHSVGGAYACKFAKKHADKVRGVVVIASTPSSAFRLDTTNIKAISIYGTNDGEAEELANATEFFPAGTPFVVIQGGNHTQCGYYDTSPNPQQPGDNPADISRDDQQQQIVSATVDFLDSL